MLITVDLIIKHQLNNLKNFENFPWTDLFVKKRKYITPQTDLFQFCFFLKSQRITDTISTMYSIFVLSASQDAARRSCKTQKIVEDCFRLWHEPAESIQ